MQEVYDVITAIWPWIYGELCMGICHNLYHKLFTDFDRYEQKLAYASHGESRGVVPQPTPTWNRTPMHRQQHTTESNAGSIIQERIIIPLPLICFKASLRGLLFEDMAGSASRCQHGTLQESSGDE